MMQHAKSWIDVYRQIVALPGGMAIDITRGDMCKLMECNRTGIELLTSASEVYIKEAIDTWPMLSEYMISHDLIRGTYRFYRPVEPPQ